MEKNRIDVFIDKNAIKDEGNGVISFNKGLTLSDESTQKNGTRYDIGSMDISAYDGKVFADHNYELTGLIGKAYGVAKRAKRLVAEGVKFAVNDNPLAYFVYNMVRNGWITDVSIGTIGELEDDDDTGDMIYKNARLVEFSFVGIGNNDNAHINAVAKNAYEYAKAEGLDTKELDTYLEAKHINVKENNQMADTPKDPAPAPQAPPAEETPSTPAPAPAAPQYDESKFTEMVENAIKAATAPLQEKLDKVEKDAFDKNAVEPEFKPAGNATPVKTGLEANLSSMPWQEITGLQVQKFWKAEKQGDSEARKELQAINKFNLEGLKEQGIVKKNVISISDFGNFVTNPELVTEIQGYRSDFSEILRAFNYTETSSLVMGWTNRSGDINMEPVELCDDGADGNLKPISEYTLTAQTKTLEELAAVTPVCNAATIFLAADLIEDVTQGYRTDYDRKLAQGIVGSLEKALEANAANSQIGWSSGGIDTAAERLENFRLAIFSISQGNGVLVMNEATYGQIWGDLVATGNGGALTSTVQSGLTTNSLWGKTFVIVPNELMPTIVSGTSTAWTLDGATVTVNHAVFYVNPANFRGRQNGGLRFDLSTDAAYEVDGTVYSAYQRNELVLRGSMFRGTAVLDPTRVRGIRARDVIS